MANERRRGRAAAAKRPAASGGRCGFARPAMARAGGRHAGRWPRHHHQPENPCERAGSL